MLRTESLMEHVYADTIVMIPGVIQYHRCNFSEIKNLVRSSHRLIWCISMLPADFTYRSKVDEISIDCFVAPNIQLDIALRQYVQYPLVNSISDPLYVSDQAFCFSVGQPINSNDSFRYASMYMSLNQIGYLPDELNTFVLMNLGMII